MTLNRKYPGHPNINSKSPSTAAIAKQHTGHKAASEHGKHVIVSSEPTTYEEKEWKLIPKNNIVLVDETGNLSMRPLEYDGTLDAVDRISSVGPVFMMRSSHGHE